MNIRKVLLLLLFTPAGICAFAQNTNLGTNAGNAGSFNTSIGYEAGDVTNATSGTFLGHQAGKAVSTGNYNSFLGSFSGSRTTYGSGNVFAGHASGYFNTGGENNIFVGIWCGFNNVTGSRNVFQGAFAGYSNYSGSDNTFSGFEAGNYNGTGWDNVFIGTASGKNNYSGSYNTFIGSGAGYANSTAHRNTFVGNETGYNNTAHGNTFMGDRAGYTNTTGGSNTFLGTTSGFNNTTGQDGVFVGSGAGVSNTTAWGNTFVGTRAGQLTAGSSGYNVMLGYEAGAHATSGHSNVYLGGQTGSYNSTGTNNVFLGHLAGFQNNGSNNVFIGSDAGKWTLGSDQLIIASGSNTLLYGNFASGQLGIGTSSLGSYALSVNGDAFATGVWVSSDRRYKQNEKPIDGALEKIHHVNGVSYQFKKGKETNDRRFSEGEQIGFIAQDLKKIFPELVKEDGDGYMAVNYQGMIPVLVEAIKELSAEVAQLKTELANKLSTGEEEINGKTRGVGLLQNHPNPFDRETTIDYELPDDAANASLYIFDLNGKQLASYPFLQRGKGSITISANQLGPGLYHYTLVVNGAIVDTKKMLITDTGR